MRARALLAAAILASCGMGSPPSLSHRDIEVRSYVYADGSLPGPDNLGLTYEGLENRDGRIQVLINGDLTLDDDADKIVRVICHELLNAVVLDVGRPADAEYGWYVVDADTLPPFAPVPDAEGAWLAASGNRHAVIVRDGWLGEPTVSAIERLNEAAGLGVFWVEGE